MWAWLLSPFLLLGWVLLWAATAVYLVHNKVIYIPGLGDRLGWRRFVGVNPAGWRSPADLGMPYENVYVPQEDGSGPLVHAWFIRAPPAGEGAPLPPTVLFFHGNAGNIGFRLVNYRQLFGATAGANILAVDYRGFGNSEGVPSERGLRRDAAACLAYLRSRRDAVDPERIFVFGRSLGGAVSASLLETHAAQLRGVVLENTFTAIEDMAIVLAARVGLERPDRARPLVRAMLRSPWTTQRRVAGAPASLELLLISGEKDELIPPAHMAALRSAAEAREGGAGASSTHFLSVPNGTHNDTDEHGGAAYYQRLREFFGVPGRLTPGRDGLILVR